MDKARMLLQQIIKDTFPWVDTEKVKDADLFREDLGFDSLNLVNLQVVLEDRLNIRFDPIQMDIYLIFSSFGSLADFISKYMKN